MRRGLAKNNRQLVGGTISQASEVEELEDNPFEIASDVIFSETVQRRDDTMTYLIGSGDENSHNETNKAKSGKPVGGRRISGR